MSSTREQAVPVAGRPPRRRWAFLARPGWIAVILAALAFAAACFFVLAPWQFDRNTERVTQNTAIEAAIAAPAGPVDSLLSTTAPPPADISWRVVTATGEFDGSRQAFVRLRQDSAGQPVTEVVVPFRLTTGQLLLVDRGYISFADDRSGTPVPSLPTGEVTITGRVQGEQSDPANRPIQVIDGRTLVYAVNVAAVGGTLPGEEFLQGYIQLTTDSPGVLAPIEVPQTDSGPFLSYALQWLAFGVIALIGITVFVVREVTDPRSPDDREPGSDSPSPAEVVSVPTGRPGPTPAAIPERVDRSQLYDS